MSKRHNKIEYVKYALLDDYKFRIIRWTVPIGTKAGPLAADELGLLDEENQMIHIRACESKTAEKRIIVHELLHRALGSKYTRHYSRTLRSSGKVVSTWTTGCLCGLHPEFARMNEWNHGFAYVTSDIDGAFTVENKRIVDGRIW